MFMSKKALCDFYEKELEDCRESGILFSLHVKATMMKVSHPIVFGHCVKIFYKEAFEKHGELFNELGVNVNNGMVDLYDKIETLPESQARRDHPRPARLPRAPPRAGDGRLRQGHHQLPLAQRRDRRRLDAGDDPPRRQDVGRRRPPYDAKAVMPESTFARIYQEMINFCKWHGNFDPKTMGTVPNVGLMAQQAEEYGSHDKTFEIPEDGVANIVDIDTGEVLLTQNVEARRHLAHVPGQGRRRSATGSSWPSPAPATPACRPCSGSTPTVRTRAQLITKVKMYLQEHDTTGLDIQIMSQVRAMRFTLERVIRGLDTISRHRQHPARLPDRPVPDHGTGHLAPRCCPSSR